MDEYTKAGIRFRFEDMKRKNNNSLACAYALGYIASLRDADMISHEEFIKASDAAIAWLDEERKKPKCFGDSGLVFAEIHNKENEPVECQPFEIREE